MANLADEYGTDVEIYVKALTTTIRADTPTGAPAELHDLLERLGLERHTYAEPLCIWHTVPEHLEADEQKRLATGVIPALLLAGYTVNCDPDVFDEAVYQQAEHKALTSRPTAAPQRLTPGRVAPPASPRRVL
ncbi:hypothetical protein PV387_40675 [Streptomyces sp. ME02-6987-2C]|uniref:hypothetical protein n=1 Tax=unclassified Streptomyces TaxID=2593676 RepID=UPI0029B3CCCC|nr:MULTISPECIES: hypothetical protein [unclassified Streptomyces]MDX3372225.1 hypothetical protein [Streptomyces sp. ME02-6987-2C]MDX3426340.1 hypothetical protein [Streptomyces sp. ME02-6985-2c]